MTGGLRSLYTQVSACGRLPQGHLCALGFIASTRLPPGFREAITQSFHS